MIRLLSWEDRSIVEGLPVQSFAALRIRSVLKAYGFPYDFVRFYASEDGGTVICVQEGLSVLWTRDSDSRRLSEAAEFLPFTAEAILTETPLPLEGYHMESGAAYNCTEYPAYGEPHYGLGSPSQQNCTYSLDEGFQILSRVFPETINRNTYAQWYADLSHRIRHGVSKLYTLNGACTAVRYGVEEGWAGVSQLATLPEHRGRGLASALLLTIAADTLPEKGMLVQSQTPNSDRFYEKSGFTRCGSWYSYLK